MEAEKERLKTLKTEELTAEIAREEDQLAFVKNALGDTEKSLKAIEGQILAEQARDETQRWLKRQETINTITQRIIDRQQRIADLTQRINELERGRPWFYLSLVGRYMRQTVIDDLKETIRGIQRTQSREIRIRGAYRGWQTREVALIERLRELQRGSEELSSEIGVLQSRISQEEELLTYKQSLLPNFFRVQKARTYYAYAPGSDTPRPFAEFRVWVFTNAKDEDEAEQAYPERNLGQKLNELEFAVSRASGRTHIVWARAVYSEQAYECRRVDPEEVDVPLDELQYFVVFWDKHGEEKGTYKTEQVKEWLRTGLGGLAAAEYVGQISLEQWTTRPIPPRKYAPRRKRR